MGERGCEAIRDMLGFSDAMLLEGLRHGDTEAWAALFARYREQVYRVLFRLMANREEAEDLTQEVFIRLYRHPLRDRRDTNLSAWLYRVATNLGYNAHRAERRRGEQRQQVGEGTLAEIGGDGEAADPAKRAVAQEERWLVRRALSELPARYQACLALRYQGLSYGEIAAALGVAPSSVGTVLARAERQFKERYLRLANRGVSPAAASDDGTEGKERRQP